MSKTITAVHKSERTPAPRSDDVIRWAGNQFDATGATVDRIVKTAIAEFGSDEQWIREFVVENLRACCVAGVTRLQRSPLLAPDEDDPDPDAVPVVPKAGRATSDREIDGSRGVLLQRRRKKLGMSLDALAKFSGVSRWKVAAIESGQKAIPIELYRKLVKTIDAYEDLKG